MIAVPLNSNIGVGGLKSHTINLRPPGSAVVRRIKEELTSDGQLPLSAIPRLAARLSWHSEGKIKKLCEADLVSLRNAIMELFAKEARRLRARKLHKSECSKSALNQSSGDAADLTVIAE